MSTRPSSERESDLGYDQEAQSKAKDPAADNYSHGFWDREIAPLRKEYLIGISRVTVLITILIWGVVTIYWGSLSGELERTPNISAMVVNRDSGAIGTNITNTLLATNTGQLPHLTWTSVDPSKYPTRGDIIKAVAVDYDTWVIVDILQDATTVLESARNNGDPSWDPTSVVTVAYAEARNQIAMDGPILGSVRSILTSSLAQIGASLTAQWLSQNSGNAGAISRIASAPQTITPGISMNMLNTRPFDVPLALAPTFVGLIYLMILAFNITMGNFGMRQGISRKLTLPSFIAMRILVPFATYIWLALMFSMINLPFKLPFGRMGEGYAAGFFAFYGFSLLGMGVLGLATEAFLSLVGPPFIGFCLLSFIIINVSVANLPIELQNRFYQLGYALPFYNLRQAYLTIVFNVGSHAQLLKYWGILMAWLVLLMLTIPVWVWLERIREKKAGGSPLAGASSAQQQQGESDKDASEQQLSAQSKDHDAPISDPEKEREETHIY